MSYDDMDTRASLRQQWEFSYSAKSLQEAALAKFEYRLKREQWWIKAKAKVMTEIADGGIQVSESVAASYSNSGLRGPQVMVKADLQTKLTECHQKIMEHNRAARDYNGWAQMLGAMDPSVHLTLRHDDWLYFFGDDAVLNPDDVQSDTDG